MTHDGHVPIYMMNIFMKPQEGLVEVDWLIMIFHSERHIHRLTVHFGALALAVRKFSNFYGTWLTNLVFTGTSPSLMDPIFSVLPYFLKIHFNIIRLSTSFFPSCIFPFWSVPWFNFSTFPCVPHVQYVPRLSFVTLFYIVVSNTEGTGGTFGEIMDIIRIGDETLAGKRGKFRDYVHNFEYYFSCI
jgi:hypothetical protein